MNKEQIIEQLKKSYGSFTAFIRSLNEQDFLFTANEKWTAGQQAEHILRAIKPVNLAFGIPRFSLRLMFGKANRPSKTYEQLVQKYKDKLAAGGRASGRFIPHPVEYKEQQKICDAINSVNDDLCDKVNRTNEEELDAYILPHPLLGKLTLREMLYFNIFHVQHHQESVQKLISREM